MAIGTKLIVRPRRVAVRSVPVIMHNSHRRSSVAPPFLVPARSAAMSDRLMPRSRNSLSLIPASSDPTGSDCAQSLSRHNSL
jgi:hypothetical protein